MTNDTQTETLTTWLRRRTATLLEAVAGRLAALGLTPNAVSAAGAIVATGAGVLAAFGWLRPAALVFALGSALDALDGALARATDSASAVGALLDSTLDRIGEAALLIGLAVHFTGDPWVVGLAGASLAGSLMVSYTRARAEGLGAAPKAGPMTRVERVILLTLTLLTGWITVGLAVLAALAWVTVIRRVRQAAHTLNATDITEDTA